MRGDISERSRASIHASECLNLQFQLTCMHAYKGACKQFHPVHAQDLCGHCNLHAYANAWTCTIRIFFCMHAIWNFPPYESSRGTTTWQPSTWSASPLFESMHEHSQFIIPFEFGRDAFPNNPCTFEFTFFENKDRVNLFVRSRKLLLYILDIEFRKLYILALKSTFITCCPDHRLLLYVLLFCFYFPEQYFWTLYL